MVNTNPFNFLVIPADDVLMVKKVMQVATTLTKSMLHKYRGSV